MSDNREAVAGALAALGSAYRGDWSQVDGRTTRDEMNGLAAALAADSDPTTLEALCLELGVCPVERCWYEHCTTVDQGWCEHAKAEAERQQAS